MHRFRPCRWLLIGLALCSAAAWAAPPVHTLVWRGDITTGETLMQSLAKAWRKAGHAPLELEPFSTISGIDALVAGKADLAGSVRAPFAKRASEAGLTFTPVVWDALVVIVNPDNPVRDLSLAQLHDIYLGKIDNWKGVGGPDKPIHLHSVASPLDGIEFSLRNYLFRQGNQPVASRRLYINTEQLEAAVSLDPLALGATTLSRVYDNEDLAMLAINGVRPSLAHVRDRSYPLYQPLYLVTAPDDPQRTAVTAFLRFVASPAGQAAMASQHVLPYDGTTLLADSFDRHRTKVQDMGSPRSNGPVAAPGATYAARAAQAPGSKRLLQSRQRLAMKRERAAASAAATAANRKRTAQATSD